jgi:hypothetical protein
MIFIEFFCFYWNLFYFFGYRIKKYGIILPPLFRGIYLQLIRNKQQLIISKKPVQTKGLIIFKLNSVLHLQAKKLSRIRFAIELSNYYTEI